MTLESRDRWVRAAEGWEKQADKFGRDSMPVSSRMVDALAPQPGHVILDLAAGVGDTGYLAAELIRPGGTLITSDFAPEMLAAAQRRAQTKGIENVRFRQIDMSVPIDQPAASLDGVLCRWGYMLLEDPESALRDTRRILKLNGRLALAAWTGPSENLWSTAPIKIMQARGIIEKDPATGPGQFAWADPHTITETMETAGFIQPEIEAVDFDIHYDDVDDWWVAQTQMSTRTGDADRQMDFATRSDVLADLEKAAEPFTQADDSLIIPARTWVATATA
jgi:ubiquinone/menaquinone biosynthesis C-methylase UbiE